MRQIPFIEDLLLERNPNEKNTSTFPSLTRDLSWTFTTLSFLNKVHLTSLNDQFQGRRPWKMALFYLQDKLWKKHLPVSSSWSCSWKIAAMIHCMYVWLRELSIWSKKLSLHEILSVAVRTSIKVLKDIRNLHLPRSVGWRARLHSVGHQWSRISNACSL